MPAHSAAQEIETHAADWAARLDRGLNANEERDLADWLSRDARHDGALARAQAVWLHAARASAVGPARTQGITGSAARGNVRVAPAAAAIPEPARALAFPPESPSRRRWMIAGGSILMGSAAASFAFFTPRAQKRMADQVFDTGPGQIAHVSIDDRVRMVLDTASRVTLSHASDGPLLYLDEGRVMFEIAAGGGYPLIILARHMIMQCSDGRFTVSALMHQAMDIAVAAGEVMIDSVAGPRGGGRILGVRSQFMVPDGAPLSAGRLGMISAEALDALMQWEKGLLSFSNITLQDAVVQINRYGGVPLAVRGRRLADEPVTGIFRSNDPDGFASAISESLGAHTFRQGGVIIISR